MINLMIKVKIPIMNMISEVSVPKGWAFQISCSSIIFYKENIFDLLYEQNPHKLEVRGGTKKEYSDVDITHPKVVDVSSVEEFLQNDSTTLNSRKEGETNQNNKSLRSHLVIRIRIQFLNHDHDLEEEGSLTFVDLAGSEHYDSEEGGGCDRRMANFFLSRM